MVLAILTFLVTIGLLVFVHELGHFIAARRAGMGVEEFGFGFPPRIVGIQRVGGRWRVMRRSSDLRAASELECGGDSPTIYSLNWIPFGGFVRITGESGGDADDPRSFAAKPRWQRALVLFAGVAMNCLLTVVLLSTVFAIGAPQVLDGIPTSAHVREERTTVAGVLTGSPAATIGIHPGDAIRTVDGQAFVSITDVQQYIRAAGDRELVVSLERDRATREVRVRPSPLPGVERPGIGVQLVRTGIVSFPIHRAVWEGVRATGFILREIVVSFGTLFRGLVAERRVAVDIAGPIGIAVMTGQVAQIGVVALLQFAAVLSANLALLNVFPFPALDGGRLFLLCLEAIRRRSLTKRVESAIHAAGFAVLLTLIVAVTYRDIVTFGGGIWSSLRSVVGF